MMSLTPIVLSRLMFVQAIVFSLLLMSCGAEGSEAAAKASSSNPASETSVSTDLVNNPATADPAASTSTGGVPVMTFPADKHDFGEIIQGEAVEYQFKFTNTGDAPLIITKATGSCGCTVPDWPREPIAPGESNFLKVTYDSKGRKGIFNKKVTITANTVPNSNLLSISGNVIVPEG